MKAEYQAWPWDEWTPIFNDIFSSPDHTPDSGDRRVLQATIVADNDDIATHDLPELIVTGELICAEVDQLFPLRSHKLVVADYVGVTEYQRQHLHWDMQRVSVGSCTLSVFGAIERDITPVDGLQSYFIAGSTHGLPRPWHEVPIRLHRGNAFALPSNVFHASGCVPFDQPKDSRRTISFFGISRHDVTYRFTCGVATPFWAKQSRD